MGTNFQIRLYILTETFFRFRTWITEGTLHFVHKASRFLGKLIRVHIYNYKQLYIDKEYITTLFWYSLPSAK